MTKHTVQVMSKVKQKAITNSRNMHRLNSLACHNHQKWYYVEAKKPNWMCLISSYFHQPINREKHLSLCSEPPGSLCLPLYLSFNPCLLI